MPAPYLSIVQTIKGSNLPSQAQKQLIKLVQTQQTDVQNVATAVYTLAQRMDAGNTSGNASAIAALVGPGQLTTIK